MSPSVPLRAHYPGDGPWEETLFLEARLPDGRGLWLRWTLDGGPPLAASVWAFLFQPDGVRAWRVTGPPTASPYPTPSGHEVRLDGCAGEVGALRWDLAFEAGAAGHRLIPRVFGRIPIPRRDYSTPVADLRLRGRLELDGVALPVSGGRGVLGHIRGRRNALRGWAWAHAAGFEAASDAVFEALSVRLDRPALRHRPLTSLVLHLDGRRWSFVSSLGLVLHRSGFGDRTWSFSARAGRARLDGVLTLPSPLRTARTAYPTPGGPRYVRNSPRSSFVLRLRAPGIDRELKTGSGTLEIGGPEPLADLHLP